MRPQTDPHLAMDTGVALENSAIYVGLSYQEKPGDMNMQTILGHIQVATLQVVNGYSYEMNITVKSLTQVAPNH